jgi:hypothetical protein
MANGRGTKDPKQCLTLVHHSATRTHQQENPQWQMGGAPKTHIKAQHGPTRGPQAPTNKRPLNGQLEGHQRPKAMPNTGPSECHTHPPTREPSMANRRAKKTKRKAQHWSTRGPQAPNNKRPLNGQLEGHQRPNLTPTRGPQAPTNKRRRNGQWEGLQGPYARPNTDPPEGHKYSPTRAPQWPNRRSKQTQPKAQH